REWPRIRLVEKCGQWTMSPKNSACIPRYKKRLSCSFSKRKGTSFFSGSKSYLWYMEPEVIIVGAGLAGLVAATELTRAGRKVLIVDQEPESSIGGQAYWSFGGLFLVNSPEQRRM